MVLLTAVFGITETKTRPVSLYIYSNKLTGRCRCKIFEKILSVFSLMSGPVDLMIELSIRNISTSGSLLHQFHEVLEPCSINIAWQSLPAATYSSGHSHNLSHHRTSTHNSHRTKGYVCHTDITARHEKIRYVT